MEKRIYKPINQKLNIWTVIKDMFRDIRLSRDLAWRLTVRDFKGQYRQSLLGVLWAFINPLMNTLVWIFLNSSGAVKISDTGIPYPVFVFTGTMLWSILIESVNMPLLQTSSAKSYMSKINFPKEALLLSGFYKVFFNTLIKVLLILVVLLFMKVMPTTQLILFPIVFIGISTVGFMIGMFVTPIGMLYNDISKALPFLLQFLMYFSPVVYSVSGTGMMAKIIGLNPLTPLITTGRGVLTGLPLLDLNYFILITAVALVLLFIAWFIYRVSIPIIIERNG